MKKRKKTTDDIFRVISELAKENKVINIRPTKTTLWLELVDQLRKTEEYVELLIDFEGCL